MRTVQPVFSASFIAYVEANYDEESLQNELCQVVPLPNHAADWLVANAAQMQNQFRWSQEPGLRQWLINNRLDGFTQLTVVDDDTPPEHLALLAQLKEAVPAAAANLPRLMAELATMRHSH